MKKVVVAVKDSFQVGGTGSQLDKIVFEGKNIKAINNPDFLIIHENGSELGVFNAGAWAYWKKLK